jgi:hypothetical protein
VTRRARRLPDFYSYLRKLVGDEFVERMVRGEIELLLEDGAPNVPVPVAAPTANDGLDIPAFLDRRRRVS